MAPVRGKPERKWQYLLVYNKSGRHIAMLDHAAGVTIKLNCRANDSGCEEGGE